MERKVKDVKPLCVQHADEFARKLKESFDDGYVLLGDVVMNNRRLVAMLVKYEVSEADLDANIQIEALKSELTEAHELNAKIVATHNSRIADLTQEVRNLDSFVEVLRDQLENISPNGWVAS